MYQGSFTEAPLDFLLGLVEEIVPCIPAKIYHPSSYLLQRVGDVWLHLRVLREDQTGQQGGALLGREGAQGVFEEQLGEQELVAADLTGHAALQLHGAAAVDVLEGLQHLWWPAGGVKAKAGRLAKNRSRIGGRVSIESARAWKFAVGGCRRLNSLNMDAHSKGVLHMCTSFRRFQVLIKFKPMEEKKSRASPLHLDALVVFRQQRQRLVRHEEQQPVQLLLHAHPLLDSGKLTHTRKHWLINEDAILQHVT